LGWLLLEKIPSSGQLKGWEGIPLGQQVDSFVSDEREISQAKLRQRQLGTHQH